MSVAENVRRLRELRAWSQEELAERAHLSPNTVWRVENMQRLPRPSTRQKLAAALGVDPAVLIQGEPGLERDNNNG